MMIRPNMALTTNDALKVRDRKSIWMVDYLRARRDRPHMAAFFRRKYFEDKKRE